MQITIENEFDKDDICLSEISFFIFEKIKTPEGKTIKKKILSHIETIIFCEYRLNEFNAMKYARKLNINDIVSISIKCIKKVGSKANK